MFIAGRIDCRQPISNIEFRQALARHGNGQIHCGQSDRRGSVDGSAQNDYFLRMSALEIIEQIKALPPAERAEVTRFVMEEDDSWIPESFKEGMTDIASGRVVDLDTALNERYPGDK